MTTDEVRERCEECGLPIAECSAVARARSAAEKWLRVEGYPAADAADRAKELIPDTKRANSLAAEVLRLREMVEESLYHLRLDEAAKGYHERALATLTQADERESDRG